MSQLSSSLPSPQSLSPSQMDDNWTHRPLSQYIWLTPLHTVHQYAINYLHVHVDVKTRRISTRCRHQLRPSTVYIIFHFFIGSKVFRWTICVRLCSTWRSPNGSYWIETLSNVKKRFWFDFVDILTPNEWVLLLSSDFLIVVHHRIVLTYLVTNKCTQAIC